MGAPSTACDTDALELDYSASGTKPLVKRVVMISTAGIAIGWLVMMGAAGMWLRQSHNELHDAMISPPRPPIVAPLSPSHPSVPPTPPPVPPPIISPPPPPSSFPPPEPAPPPPSPPPPSSSPAPPPTPPPISPSPPPPAGPRPFFHRPSTNCWPNNGASDVGTPSVADLPACQAACAAQSSCDAIVVPTRGSFACYLKGGLSISSCNTAGDDTQTYVRNDRAAGQCSSDCARNVLPRVPVLTASNRAVYPGWHT